MEKHVLCEQREMEVAIVFSFPIVMNILVKWHLEQEKI